jgi:hypothetical protein
MIEDKVKTKVVAKPIPIADWYLLDTPIKGHSPKNLTNTKLLINTALIKIKNKSDICCLN